MDGSYGKQLDNLREYDQVEATDRREKRDMSPTSSMEKSENMSKRKRKSSHVNENNEDCFATSFNPGVGLEEILNDKKKVGKRSMPKAKEMARKIKVRGSRETTKGISDAYKEFYDVEGESNEMFKFENKHEGTTQNTKCEISIEHIKEIGEMIEAIGDERFIAVRGSWQGKEDEVFLVCIYGPHVTQQKAFLWDRLSGLMNRWHGAWCIFGDLNVVGSVNDRINSQVNHKGSEFNEFINNMRLIEIPMGGRKFTRISDDGLKFSKLDRFLLNDEFNN
nr:RNA-directed DNA polymerase, eukaryota [Tanacetum cinerariifolium]